MRAGRAVTPRCSLRVIPILFLTVALCLNPALVHAQEDGIVSPCGWSEADLQDGLPRSLLALRDRAGSPLPEQVMGRLRSWISKCDAGDGAMAVYEMRRFASARARDMAVQTMFGIILAHGPEVQVIGSSGRLLRPGHKFSNAEKEATRILKTAAAETGWIEPAAALAELALTTRAPATLKAAGAVLPNLLQKNDTSTQLMMALADVDVAVGKEHEAVMPAQRAAGLNSAGGARRLGIARLLSDADPAEGARVYMQTLARADDRVIEEYFEDIALLLTREELAAWNALAPEDRGAWLQKAWEWRASISTQTTPARLAQHFRRLRYAFGAYRRNSFRGARPLSALWLDKKLEMTPLDDRGLTYVRHGAPDEIVKIAQQLDEREGWYYRSLAGGRALLEFNTVSIEGARRVSWGDHFMTEPFRCQGPRMQAITSKQRDYTSALGTYLGRIDALDPSLHADECSNTIAGDSGKYVARVASGVASGIISNAVMQTESATPPIAKRIQALLNTYAFRRAGRTMVAAVASLSGNGVTRVAEPGNYSLKMFAALENAATHSVTRADTVIEFSRDTPLGRDDVIRVPILLYGQPAASSTVRYSIRNVADSTQGQVVSATRTINRFDDNTLALSDIIIGGVADGAWLPGADAPLPIPGHRLVEGATFRTFYEVYGLKAGEEARIRITIAPGRALNVLNAVRELVDKREAVMVEFAERPERRADGSAQIQRDIVANLAPGSYFLDATVETADGRRATSRAELTVYPR